jgi:hypothetical protein
MEDADLRIITIDSRTVFKINKDRKLEQKGTGKG